MWHIKSVTIYLVFFLGVLGLSNNSAKLWKQKTKEMRKKREKGKKGKFEMGWGMKRHMYPPPTQVHSHIASIGSASLTPSSPYKLPLSLSLSLSLSHTQNLVIHSTIVVHCHHRTWPHPLPSKEPHKSQTKPPQIDSAPPKGKKQRQWLWSWTLFPPKPTPKPNGSSLLPSPSLRWPASDLPSSEWPPPSVPVPSQSPP